MLLPVAAVISIFNGSSVLFPVFTVTFTRIPFPSEIVDEFWAKQVVSCRASSVAKIRIEIRRPPELKRSSLDIAIRDLWGRLLTCAPIANRRKPGRVGNPPENGILPHSQTDPRPDGAVRWVSV